MGHTLIPKTHSPLYKFPPNFPFLHHYSSISSSYYNHSKNTHTQEEEEEASKNMEAIQTWVSEHKLTSIGGLWAAGIGASLVANSHTRSPMKPSLRLIHARMHAQALTLAVLSGAAAYHYYENRTAPSDPHLNQRHREVTQQAEWDLLTPF